MAKRYDRSTALLVDAAIAEARRVKDERVDPLHVVVAAATNPKLAPTVAGAMGEMGLTAVACRAYLESVATGGAGGDLKLGREIAKVVARAAALATQWNEGQVTGDLVAWGAVAVESESVRGLLSWAMVDPVELEALIAARVHAPSTGPRDDAPYDQDADLLREPASGRRSRRRRDALVEFGTDLVAEARAGRIDPHIGRAAEIDRLHAVLLRRSKNNPLLLGEPGVGKTALVEALASEIASGDAPAALAKHRVVMLDVAGMLAGARLRGDFEDRVRRLTAAIAASPVPVILFIDEVHMILSAGAAPGALALGDMLKGALARREVTVIGATTLDEFNKVFSKDEALTRRFQTIVLDPPSVAEATEICMGLRPLYERHHGVRLTAEAVAAAVSLSDRMFVDRQLPDKALDVIDETAAAVAFERLALSGRARVLADKLAALRRADHAGSGEVELVAAAIAEGFGAEVTGEVSVEHVRRVVAGMVGVPVETVSVGEASRFAELPAMLRARVLGHDDEMTAVAGLVRRRLAGFGSPKRPVSVLLAGPSGVGKTETARALADVLYGADTTRLVQIDGSEYQEAGSVSRLIGAPPGYVGYDEPGLLTEPLRRRKSVVLLFDEFDKAHPQVVDLLLQLLDEGRVTDGSGRSVDASGAIVVVTVNAAAAAVRPAGFVATNPTGGPVDVTGMFRPELLNRFDAVLSLGELSPEVLTAVARRFVDEAVARVAAHGVKVTVSDDVLSVLVSEAVEEHAGARPLRRLVRRYIEDPAANLLLSGDAAAGDGVVFDVVDGAVCSAVRRPALV